MYLVFDTSALSKIIDRNSKLIKITARPEFRAFLLPLATDAELRYGFKHGSREANNLDKYENIVRDYGLQLVCPDQETALHYADLAAYCRSNGISLSNNDLWIAAATVQTGGKLLTLDRDFARLPKLSLASI